MHHRRPDAEGGRCRRGCVRKDRNKGVHPQITQIDADGNRARRSHAASRRDFLLLTYHSVSVKRNGSLQSLECPVRSVPARAYLRSMASQAEGEDNA